MGRPKGSKNKPKNGNISLQTKPSGPFVKPTKPAEPQVTRWSAPEDFTVTVIPKEVWEKLKPGRRVKTAKNCVVNGLVFLGKISHRDPNSQFLRIEWDAKGSQAAHWKTIELVGSAMEELVNVQQPSNIPIVTPATKSVFVLPEQKPEQAPKKRGRPPGSKNKPKHKP